MMTEFFQIAGMSTLASESLKSSVRKAMPFSQKAKVEYGDPVRPIGCVILL